MTILKMSLSATVLILAIVVIRALTLHKLPKKTFLVLWGVALCRLFIPVSFPSRLSVYTLADMVKDTFAETTAPVPLPTNTTMIHGQWASPNTIAPVLMDTAGSSSSMDNRPVGLCSVLSDNTSPLSQGL
ncbi:MAG TPA: hypothetical protein DD738_10180 [Ruminiclostridium sp.]|nr:hypothetical protein [Ruminiclostridium sp.]